MNLIFIKLNLILVIGVSLLLLFIGLYLIREGGGFGSFQEGFNPSQNHELKILRAKLNILSLPYASRKPKVPLTKSDMARNVKVAKLNPTTRFDTKQRRGPGGSGRSYGITQELELRWPKTKSNTLTVMMGVKLPPPTYTKLSIRCHLPMGYTANPKCAVPDASTMCYDGIRNLLANALRFNQSLGNFIYQWNVFKMSNASWTNMANNKFKKVINFFNQIEQRQLAPTTTPMPNAEKLKTNTYKDLATISSTSGLIEDKVIANSSIQKYFKIKPKKYKNTPHQQAEKNFANFIHKYFYPLVNQFIKIRPNKTITNTSINAETSLAKRIRMIMRTQNDQLNVNIIYLFIEEMRKDAEIKGNRSMSQTNKTMATLWKQLNLTLKLTLYKQYYDTTPLLN